jgi:hypothetical protein
MGRKTDYVHPDRDCSSVDYLEGWRDLLLNGSRSRPVKDDRGRRYMKELDAEMQRAIDSDDDRERQPFKDLRVGQF